jgi:hypothetical protein
MATLIKLRRELGDVLPLAKLEPPAAALVADCIETEMAIERLIASGDLMSAVRLGAFALPRREAVWWASMCATYTAPASQPRIESDAREAAELWVHHQDDETRRRAMDLARQAGFAAPECWVAVAAFWSGDSISPVGQPVVLPAPHLVGTAVIGAIALAAVRAAPNRRYERLGRFLASLSGIASGTAGRIGREMTTV